MYYLLVLQYKAATHRLNDAVPINILGQNKGRLFEEFWHFFLYFWYVGISLLVLDPNINSSLIMPPSGWVLSSPVKTLLLKSISEEMPSIIYIAVHFFGLSLLFVPKRAERTKGVTLWNFLCFSSLQFISYSSQYNNCFDKFFRRAFPYCVHHCSNQQFPSFRNGQRLLILFFLYVVNNMFHFILHQTF